VAAGMNSFTFNGLARHGVRAWDDAAIGEARWLLVAIAVVRDRGCENLDRVYPGSTGNPQLQLL
jgi:hypothetical protein